jgi:hypothetical protein
MPMEGFLHRMQDIVLREPFDRRYTTSLRLHGQHSAGLDRFPVDVDHAAAALRRVAPDMCTGQPEVLTQEHDKKRFIIYIARYICAVYSQ